MRIGMDLVVIERVGPLAATPERLARIFTPGELALAATVVLTARLPWLAGRFAAKEAAVKALGTGFAAGVDPLQIECLADEQGQPFLALLGAARERASILGLTRWDVSITSAGTMACATVVLTSRLEHQ